MNGCPVTIGNAKNQAELQRQVADSIRCNLALAPPAFLSFPPAVINPYLRGTEPPNALQIGIDPIVGGLNLAVDDCGRIRPDSSRRIGQLEKCIACKSVSRQTAFDMTANGRNVAGPNPRRIAITFLGMSAVAYLISTEQIIGSANDLFYTFTGPNQVTFLAKDFGSMVGDNWYGAVNFGGTVRLTVTEITAI